MKSNNCDNIIINNIDGLEEKDINRKRNKVRAVIINKDKKITIINLSKNPEESIYGKYLILLHNRNILLFAPIKEALLEEKKFRQCNLELPFMDSLSL